MQASPLPFTPKARAVRTAKEIARHGLHKLGVKRRFDYLASENPADRFSKIYEEGVWTRGNSDNPGSGAGSTLAVTEDIRRELPALLDSLGSTRLLDLGCGDYTWMQEIDFSQSYVGADIVPAVIQKNNELYGDDRRSFFVADATVDGLPEADTVLCREVLFHLSFDHIRALLTNVLSAERKFFIATTDQITMFNSDIRTGDFRHLDLQRRPFRMGAPLAAIDDVGLRGGRRLAAWPADQIVRAMRLPVS